MFATETLSIFQNNHLTTHVLSNFLGSLQLKKQFFHQMAFFEDVTVNAPGFFRGDTAGDECNSSPLLDPANKFVTVIPFVCQNQPACKATARPGPCKYRYDFRWRAKNATDFQAHPSLYGPLLSGPPRLRPVSSLYCPFYSAGVLMYLDGGIIQHQCCFLHQVLSNQSCQHIVSHTSNGPDRSGRSRFPAGLQEASFPAVAALSSNSIVFHLTHVVLCFLFYFTISLHHTPYF